MPIFEFKCDDCGSVFEFVIQAGNKKGVSCPDCGSKSLKKLFSTFATTGNIRPSGGLTCCGREERCDSPPCDSGGCCKKA